MSKAYTIDCSWEMYGHVDVEADSIDEAIEKVENETKLSDINAEYVSESFKIDESAYSEGLMMSKTTDKMLDRYVYLHIDYDDWSAEKEESGITVHVKMDDEGIVVDAWGGEDKCIATTHKLYRDMGVEVKEIEDE